MENNNDILGGFSAMLNSLTPNAGFSNDGDTVDPAEGPDGFADIDKIDESKLDNHIDEPIPEFVDGDNNDKSNDNDEPTDVNTVDSNPNTDESSEIVATFFDAIAESAGWDDISDEEKPKDVESLIEYIKDVVDKSSTPSYANEEIERLDQFVKNGGSIADYFEAIPTDYNDISIETKEDQKAVLAEFLAEKGFSEAQIQRKLDKYEDADILEDEAADALESLKEIRKNNAEALLEGQKIKRQEAEAEQQKFYSSVVSEIEALKEIRDVKVPEKDKKDLVDYIFKIESDGRTRYQKDYMSSFKNLVQSAYFQMKGDSLLDSAKKKGEMSAVDKFKRTLTSNRNSGSKQKINDGSAAPLWTLVSKQLVK